MEKAFTFELSTFPASLFDKEGLQGRHFRIFLGGGGGGGGGRDGLAAEASLIGRGGVALRSPSPREHFLFLSYFM